VIARSGRRHHAGIPVLIRIAASIERGSSRGERHFIASPDLPERLRLNLALNPYDRPAYFGGTEIGYTDYPFYSAETESVV
jgi:hypothetical protein